MIPVETTIEGMDYGDAAFVSGFCVAMLWAISNRAVDLDHLVFAASVGDEGPSHRLIMAALESWQRHGSDPRASGIVAKEVIPLEVEESRAAQS